MNSARMSSLGDKIDEQGIVKKKKAKKETPVTPVTPIVPTDVKVETESTDTVGDTAVVGEVTKGRRLNK